MKLKISILLIILSLFTFSKELKVDKSLENSITKDYDQDGKVSPYEKALRNAQESIYIVLPEKRGYR